MLRSVGVLSVVAAVLLVGCSGRERVVAEPLDMVQAKLSMMPEESNAIGLAMQMMGADFYLEPKGEQLVWHFTKDGADYCRFTAQMIAAGPDKTRVITRAVETPEAADAVVAAGGARPDYAYICGIAKIAGDESVAATLEGRPANTKTIYDKIRLQAASDPMAVGRMAETMLQDAERHMESMSPCADYASQACRDWEAREDELWEESARMRREKGLPDGGPSLRME